MKATQNKFHGCLDCLLRLLCVQLLRIRLWLLLQSADDAATYRDLMKPRVEDVFSLSVVAKTKTRLSKKDWCADQRENESKRATRPTAGNARDVFSSLTKSEKKKNGKGMRGKSGRD
eukprot:TRINITY_DN3580_c0_g1_i9.p1 TRINITY_DN3580_c0_g1~~TRINITY_DN3580_c0_g1_i9.p1  ORF type:complete len:117 (-),score=23.34 TRINITY_DN3580_c0_g1_i9:216-566(-)